MEASKSMHGCKATARSASFLSLPRGGLGHHQGSTRELAKAATKRTRRRPCRCYATSILGDSSVGESEGDRQSITITAPDDWHLHLRDGKVLDDVVPHSASQFTRAIIMPNLTPPVTTVGLAKEYEERIQSQIPKGTAFKPLMTLYLTDNTPVEEVYKAKEQGVRAFKMYPAGATTNSDSGVTDVKKCFAVLRAMEETGTLLLIHGEVVDPAVDIFDRERVFIESILQEILDSFPNLRVVLEHITTKHAVEFINGAPENIGATVTPQHMLMNRNSLLVGGIKPHFYCLPILKREDHRRAIVEAVTTGDSHYFLGTDSAPHPIRSKLSACGCAGIYSAPVALPIYAQIFEEAGALDSRFENFASINGARFYGLPRNEHTVTLVKEPWKVPQSYSFGDDMVVPICAGQHLPWKLV